MKSYYFKKIIFILSVIIHCNSFAQEFTKENKTSFSVTSKWLFSSSFGFFLEPNYQRNKSQFEVPYSEGLFVFDLQTQNPNKQTSQILSQIQSRWTLIQTSKTSQQIWTPIMSEFFYSDKELQSEIDLSEGIKKFGSRFRLGLFHSPWIDVERQLWEGHIRSVASAGLWEHYRYLRTSEVGLDYSSTIDLTSSPLEWSIGILSSDGQKGQTVFQKDLYIKVSYSMDSVHFGFGSQAGLYNGLPQEANVKNRSFLWVGQSFKDSKLKWLLQGFIAEDAVDGLLGNDGFLDVAENVDLISWGGQVIKAAGFGATITVPIQTTNIYMKYDFLDPNHKQKNDSTSTSVCGLTLPWRQGEVFMQTQITNFQHKHHTNPSRRVVNQLGYSLRF